MLSYLVFAFAPVTWTIGDAMSDHLVRVIASWLRPRGTTTRDRGDTSLDAVRASVTVLA